MDLLLPKLGLLRSGIILLGGLWGLVACTAGGGFAGFGGGLPAELGPGVRTPTPTHPLRVALLPIVDDRRGPDGEEPDELYVYRGTTYRATQVGETGAPTPRLTEVVARHLAQSRAFAQVILVLNESQAPEAELFVEGRLTRLRGYVEAEAPPAKSGRPADERQVLAEVLIKNLKVRDRTGRVYFDGDVGWSIVEARRLPAGVEPDPWDILGEALRVGLEAWIAEIRAADLSGRVVVLGKAAAKASTTGTVALEGLSEHLPPGWALATRTATATPIGWRGPASCDALHFRQQQSFRFHRALGPYHPGVTIWRCPDHLQFRYGGQAEFPARFLGTLPGQLYFSLAIGESNWRDAEAEFARLLNVQPPSTRHLFELGGPSPARPPPPPPPGARLPRPVLRR